MAQTMRGFLALPVAVVGIVLIAAAFAFDHLGNIFLQLSCVIAGTPGPGYRGIDRNDRDDDHFRL